jgi:hypothetical protein
MLRYGRLNQLGARRSIVPNSVIAELLPALL